MPKPEDDKKAKKAVKKQGGAKKDEKPFRRKGNPTQLVLQPGERVEPESRGENLIIINIKEVYKH